LIAHAGAATAAAAWERAARAATDEAEYAAAAATA